MCGSGLEFLRPNSVRPILRPEGSRPRPEYSRPWSSPEN